MIELSQCMPCPKADLPSCLKELVGFGDDIIKSKNHIMSRKEIGIINDFNFAISRLWTYAMIKDKAVCWIDYNTEENLFEFTAYKVEDQKEYTSSVCIPNNIDIDILCTMIIPMLANQYNAVYDKGMFNILESMYDQVKES